jgi:hypothetical protein
VTGTGAEQIIFALTVLRTPAADIHTTANVHDSASSPDHGFCRQLDEEAERAAVGAYKTLLVE